MGEEQFLKREGYIQDWMVCLAAFEEYVNMLMKNNGVYCYEEWE